MSGGRIRSLTIAKGVKRPPIPSLEAAEAWVGRMQRGGERPASTRADAGDVLSRSIGDRWARGIDPTSTYDPYEAGLRLRVLPTLGTCR